jgi:hypothetical protein
VVHRPDLLLWIGGPKVGLGLWNYPLPEMALELGLVAIAGGAWIAKRKDLGMVAWPAVAFLAFLTVLQMVSSFGAMGPDVVQDGATALAAYMVATLVAWAVDRGKARVA